MRILLLVLILLLNFNLALAKKKSIPDGEQIVYRKNGTLKEKASYKSGLLEGTKYEYYEDGKTLKRLTKYKQGRKIGIQKFYDKIGILKDFKKF
jgi:antitoxin component YwqK of YwqJK toxin-antitoxin module